MVWCASTEIFLKPTDAHRDIESFEKALKARSPEIAPSMVYAYAALSLGIPFANGAPNLTVDIPALIELAREKNVPVCGKDFKTGQTLMKTILAPGPQGAHARPQRLVLDEHPREPRRRGARRSRIVQDEGGEQALRARAHPPAEALPRPVREVLPRRADQLLSAARGQQGRLGQHRHLRLARLSDADQDQLPLPRLASSPRRSSSTSRSSWTWRSGSACAASRNGSRSTSRARCTRRGSTPSTISSSSS